MSGPRFCDYWLVSRRQCRAAGTVEAQDRYGAPLRFCARHWMKVQTNDQYARPLTQVNAGLDTTT